MTEYLILLAILVGGALLAVSDAAIGLSNAWSAWGGVYEKLGNKSI